MTDPLTVRGCDALLEVGGERVGPVEVAICDGRIETIAPTDGSSPDGVAILDANGLLAIPGLVNAHTHSPENPLRGLGEGPVLEPWLALTFGSSGSNSPEDHHACVLAGAVEMLRTGTTAVVDHLWMTPPSIEAIDAVMRACRDAGLVGRTLAPAALGQPYLRE